MTIVAEVRLFDDLIGAVAEDDAGVISFEYDPEFARRGIEPSPLRLPVATVGPVTFPSLRALEAFDGLPGLLADALPDRFGNAIIRQYFERKGDPDAALSPVQRLLYIGDRAMGALHSVPAIDVPVDLRASEALELSRLVIESRAVIAGQTDVALPEIIKVGASAGGARAKAVVLWNRSSNVLKSAFAEREPGDEDWIIKFDGVGEFGAATDKSQPFTRIETAYAAMAHHAGIELPETALIQQGGLAHFAIRRFDRTNDGSRIHMHSLGGLLHADYNAPGTTSYEEAFRAILELRLDDRTIDQWFRRMVFNVAARNQDDHVKNVSFLMDASGTWSLAPAYDVTFAVGRGFTRRHQMTVNGKAEGIERGDLLAVGKRYGVVRAAETIDAVLEAVSLWPRFASEMGVSDDEVKAIRDLHIASGLFGGVTYLMGVPDMNRAPKIGGSISR